MKMIRKEDGIYQGELKKSYHRIAFGGSYFLSEKESNQRNLVEIETHY